MEEYLQYLKTLRSQMNDVEDQAAKISVEEQMQMTTIQAMEKDLNSAVSETKQLKEDTKQMMNTKGQICSQILKKQRRIAFLEFDSSTLTQGEKNKRKILTNTRTPPAIKRGANGREQEPSLLDIDRDEFDYEDSEHGLEDDASIGKELGPETLELMQQEKASLSVKHTEKSVYYTKVAEDINTKLQEQQDWVNCHNIGRGMGEHGLAKDKIVEQMTETEENSSIDNHLIIDNMGNEASKENLMAKLDSAKTNLDRVAQMKSKLVMDNSKMKQSIEQVKCRANDFKPELLAMDIKTLEEEHKALQSDKAGETEYFKSLQDQIEKLKGISHMIKCGCGEEYKVEVNLYA